MTSLAYLVNSVCYARQQTLDSSLSAVRAYAAALLAESELPETEIERRQWCVDTAGKLEKIWADLDRVRWDYGPAGSGGRKT